MNDLKSIAVKLCEDYEKASAQGSAESLERLLTVIEELSDFIREKIQELTREDMLKVIDKLKNGLTITPQDRDQIRLWVVGDAEQYARSAHCLDEWKGALKRVMDEIGAFRDAGDQVADYAKFTGLLRDARRILADIHHLQLQKDRVDKFYEAIREVGDAERPILIRILEQKMDSPDF